MPYDGLLDIWPLKLILSSLHAPVRITCDTYIHAYIDGHVCTSMDSHLLHVSFVCLLIYAFRFCKDLVI